MKLHTALLLLPLAACVPVGDDVESDKVDKGIHTADQNDGGHLTIVDARDETTWRRLDFESGAEVSEDSPAWDLGFLRFNVATRVEVAALEGAHFDAIEVAPADGYATDANAGDPADKETMPGYAFDLWYDYDPTTHVLTARDVVYVVRSAEDNYYKVQMQDYYDDAGTSGYVSLRWAAIAAPE